MVPLGITQRDDKNQEGVIGYGMRECRRNYNGHGKQLPVTAGDREQGRGIGKHGIPDAPGLCGEDGQVREDMQGLGAGLPGSD